MNTIFDIEEYDVRCQMKRQMNKDRLQKESVLEINVRALETVRRSRQMDRQVMEQTDEAKCPTHSS